MSIPFPDINPVAFSAGPIHVHWYGLMYLLGFSLAWLFARWRVKRYHLPWTPIQISDLIFYSALGAVLGGRVGYMLFYNTYELIHDPFTIVKIWQGGMSFHGGLIGVIIAIALYARHIKRPFWVVADFAVPLVPLGLAAGRIGNFINGELWGRPTSVPWSMVFPEADNLPRHPSQLYECGLEGLLLFVLVAWYASKSRPTRHVSALFLMGYALCRFSVEFFRQPDSQIGFVMLPWMTMGQLLSIPMFIVGLILYYSCHQPNRIKKHANLS